MGGYDRVGSRSRSIATPSPGNRRLPRAGDAAASACAVGTGRTAGHVSRPPLVFERGGAARWRSIRTPCRFWSTPLTWRRATFMPGWRWAGATSAPGGWMRRSKACSGARSRAQGTPHRVQPGLLLQLERGEAAGAGLFVAGDFEQSCPARHGQPGIGLRPDPLRSRISSARQRHCLRATRASQRYRRFAAVAVRRPSSGVACAARLPQ